MTLLEFFIDDCNKAFREPERKGVQKGLDIGVFRGRFNAALYALYNFEKKEVARLAGITYPFMRKLVVEEKFKKQHVLLLDLFTENYLYPYLTDGYIVKSDLLAPTYSNCKIYDGNKVILPYEVDELFADAENYSLILKGLISSDIPTYLNQMGILRWLNSRERLLYLLTKWNEPEMNRKIFSAIFPLGEEVIRRTLDRVSIPEPLKADALNCIRFMRDIAAAI